MEKRYYAAYGSNLNIRQMLMRCPNARVLGTSWLENYELLYKGSRTGAYLTVETKDGSRVPIGIWEVTEADEAALDRYEGFPTFYYKKEITLPITGIKTGKVRNRKCFLYIMHEERKQGIPSRQYVETVKKGYRAFQFNGHYLAEAENKAKEATENEREYHFDWF